MADLRRRAGERLNTPPSAWDPGSDWLANWSEIESWLVERTRELNCRLILAFDEYETLHRYLQVDPEQGRRLLGAIRSFTQHQTQVCLLFAGATPFSELRNPDWAEFFVQAVRLRVDYLSRPNSLRLITEPVPSIRYPPDVPERLFELTQGHPALLQSLCKALVDIANRDERRAMTMADLDEALDKGVDREHPGNGALLERVLRRPRMPRLRGGPLGRAQTDEPAGTNASRRARIHHPEERPLAYARPPLRGVAAPIP